MARSSSSNEQKIRFKDFEKRKRQRFMEVFGMPSGTMRNRLRAKIIYDFFVLRDGDKCFRCNEPVKQKDYSIDHSESFWDAMDPVQSFFDVSKCFLSHVSCNTKHGHSEGQRRLEQIKKKHKALMNAFGGIGENEST